MHQRFANAYQAIAAGAIGGLLQSIVILIVSQIGLFAVLQLPLSFDFNLVWIYQRVTWGGLWGLFFLLPVLRGTPHWKRGFLVGILPALASSLIFLPFKDGHGYFGMNLGAMMPVVVMAFGPLWGVITGFLLDRTRPAEDEADSELGL